MRARSLTTTLALAFAATTLAVFGVVGSFVYLALAQQVRVQDDLDIVLAARHTRRLAEELQNVADIRKFNERLESQVLGNEALSLAIMDTSGQVIVQHNLATLARSLAPLARPVGAADRITHRSIVETTAPDGNPLRLLAAQVKLGDGTIADILIVRNMHDRWLLLDRYRDRLHLAGAIGVLLTFALGYFLVRRALRPLRDMADNAAGVTVERLDTRIESECGPLEMKPLITSINGMLAGLERSFQRLSQFTADLAHDMRTPLANMRGATEVALARPRSAEEYQTLLASNLEECDRLSRMIENVLFLARAEHPLFSREMREFEVADELQRIAEYFEGLAEDAGVQLVLTGEGRLKADVELFRRAVSNLLANAVRHTPAGGTISLGARVDSEGVRVIVENEGEPIDPQLLERVFDRFYRGDPSRAGGSEGGSAGLGLAIVRTIMELHGGRAHAESGTRTSRFVLSFPHPS